MKKGLLLLSGGFDSPVAGWMMKQKGAKLSAIHFSSELVTDRSPEEKSKRAAEILGIQNLIVVDISGELLEISKKCDHKLYFVLMKRLMYRLAEKIAEKEGCDFLVTGENLGQVSSQTLDNLIVIDKSVKMPVIRPLIGFDKQEIIDLAKQIGTYEISKGPEHCDALGPEHPYTKTTLEEVLIEESKI